MPIDSVAPPPASAPESASPTGSSSFPPSKLVLNQAGAFERPIQLGDVRLDQHLTGDADRRVAQITAGQPADLGGRLRISLEIDVPIRDAKPIEMAPHHLRHCTPSSPVDG